MKSFIIKILSLAFCLVLYLCVVPSAAADGEIVSAGAHSGTCGDNVTWTLTEDRVLTISGTGPMYDYMFVSKPWDYLNFDSVVITDGVTSIGSRAFFETDLIDVTISTSVTSIGREAFRLCQNLRSVVIPKNVTDMGELAFCNCYSLESVTISNGVTCIGDNAFGMCAITTVTIPSSVTTIGSEAFNECTSLTQILVDAYNPNYRSINGVLFNKNGSELIAFPAGKTGSYLIPYGVTDICHRAFSCCQGLTNVIIPTGVTYIGSSAFELCSSLTSVEIPDSVTSIDEFAFNTCSSLKDIYYLGTPEEWSHIAISNYNASLESATIHYQHIHEWGEPDYLWADDYSTVTATRVCARDHKHIEEETVSVVSNITVQPTCVKKGKVTYSTMSFSNNAFSEQSKVVDLDALDHSIVTDAAISPTCIETGLTEGSHCSRCNTILTAQQTVAALGHRPENAIQENIIPATCSAEGSYDEVVYCSVCHEELSRAKKTVSKLAHTPDMAIQENIIPATIKYTGSYDEVVYCSVCHEELSRESKTISKLRSGLCDDNIMWEVSENIDGLFDLSIIPVLKGNPAVINSIPWFDSCDLISNITFADGITGIGDSIFSGCTKITQVVFPKSMEEIGDNVFDGCTNLSKLEMNNGLLRIGSCIIQNTALNEVTIPDTVTNVQGTSFIGVENSIYATVGSNGAKAVSSAGYSFLSKDTPGIFLKYSGDDLILTNADATLRTLSIPYGVTHIGPNTFQNNTRLSKVMLPGTIKEIGEYAFYSCSRLSDVSLPYGLAIIGQHAFDSCLSLSSLNVPYSVISIGAGAFSYCSSLTLTVFQGSKAHVYAVQNYIPYVLSNQAILPFGEPDFTLPENLTTISEEAFMGVSASCIELPNKVNRIENSAFEDCRQLKQIFIPESVTYISPDAFVGTIGLTIYGIAGSYAEDFAYDYGFCFAER